MIELTVDTSNMDHVLLPIAQALFPERNATFLNGDAPIHTARIVESMAWGKFFAIYSFWNRLTSGKRDIIETEYPKVSSGFE